MIIWFKGVSGVGKSTLGSYFYNLKKKKIKNLVHVDADSFRKLFNDDLGLHTKIATQTLQDFCFYKFSPITKN